MSSAIQQHIHELDPELLVADGLDSAIVGIAERCGMPSVVAYDVDKCIAALIVEQGMDEEEAREYFEFNCASAFVGDRTPIFIRSI